MRDSSQQTKSHPMEANKAHVNYETLSKTIECRGEPDFLTRLKTAISNYSLENDTTTLQ